MGRIFNLKSAVRNSPEVEVWFSKHDDELGKIAQQWFSAIRACGDDVCELLHDGQPTACIGKAAFAYVNAYKAHVNVGFFGGAELADPAGLLEGTGKFMRHVKIRPGAAVNAASLEVLITSAYQHMQAQL